jgi:SpoVK/Ycf46/Vps4 family AAA+-type ATPase
VIDAVDLDALVARSDGLTPADIEYAARRASQQALAQALRSELGAPTGSELTTDDYLRALEATRATVSELSVREFLDDIDSYARL